MRDDYEGIEGKNGFLLDLRREKQIGKENMTFFCWNLSWNFC